LEQENVEPAAPWSSMQVMLHSAVVTQCLSVRTQAPCKLDLQQTPWLCKIIQQGAVDVVKLLSTVIFHLY